ncbi:Hypothetical_protein [Hexamita inflata]|uniref:Hypothetical_protein n=1 Tax=Hexamita inflata TaxID=28002 RepID=A0AA86QPN4_9EUKA|nr:Hypothetical protein HINF_LOCUS51216 [Hexamita inflata]
MTSTVGLQVKDQITKIQNSFAQLLPELLEPYLQSFQEKHQQFILSAMNVYVMDAPYYITAMSYLSSNEPNVEKMHDLMLLSFVMHFQARVQIEQQLHIQNSLRKILSDELVVPLQSFLTLVASQLVFKLYDMRICSLVQRFYQLQTTCLFEQARFISHKTHDYVPIATFKQFYAFEFHSRLGSEQVPESALKQLLKIHLLRNNKTLDIINYIKNYSVKTNQPQIYQELLINKLSVEKTVQIANTYLLDQRINEDVEEMNKELETVLIGCDAKWEWMGFV